MAKLENVNLKQDDFTLVIPKWEFSDSEISAVWGQSGSGKTTLLWLMAGLFEQSGMVLVVNGEDLATKPTSQRGVSVVFQDYALFPHMTAQQNILFPAEAKGIAPKTWEPTFGKLVEKLRIQNILKRKASVLSGGECQRVALARALILQPKLVLLDEPFSALDESLKQEARQLVKELNAEFKIPFVLVSHDIRDVEALASQVLVLQNGRVVQEKHLPGK